MGARNWAPNWLTGGRHRVCNKRDQDKPPLIMDKAHIERTRSQTTVRKGSTHLDAPSPEVKRVPGTPISQVSYAPCRPRLGKPRNSEIDADGAGQGERKSREEINFTK